MKNFFYKNTANVIKHEMSRALNYECFDEVWLIESDKMKNYKCYFESDNSCNLIDKFAVHNRAETIYI
jgi:hypothetical protein